MAESSDPVLNSHDAVAATAREWGGQGGYFTCDQWRAYVTRMARIGDPRHKGYIDAAGFELIKKASPVFENASFDYFDMQGKGRISQKEFVEFESPFFARFDKNHTCHVTLEDIRAASKPQEAPPLDRNSGQNAGNSMNGSGPGLGGNFGGRQ